MKRKITSLLSVMAACGLLILACTKADINFNADSVANLQVQSDDQSRFSAESDAVSDDANLLLNDPSFNSGFNASETQASSLNNIICDATVAVDTMSNPRTVTITYNGTNCGGNRTRKGQVILSMPAGMHWGDVNAVLTVNIKNLAIKRLSDNKSITLNGIHTITNVTGGRLINLPNLSSIVHRVSSSNMSVTFDDGSQRTWQVAKQRTFTYNNGVVITITGLHSDGSHEGIAEWGLNRFGKAFSSAITQAIVLRQDCSFRIVSGAIQHIRADITTSATFGLDISGNSTTCPGTGNYFLQLIWTDKTGKEYKFILPY
ncbi:MAG TPA: hypothetical protein VM012_12455 [Flavitalea sp.]|nr:hypothetical protein [Flavitalea sp.]